MLKKTSKSFSTFHLNRKRKEPYLEQIRRNAGENKKNMYNISYTTFPSSNLIPEPFSQPVFKCVVLPEENKSQ